MSNRSEWIGPINKAHTDRSEGLGLIDQPMRDHERDALLRGEKQQRNVMLGLFVLGKCVDMSKVFANIHTWLFDNENVFRRSVDMSQGVPTLSIKERHPQRKRHLKNLYLFHLFLKPLWFVKPIVLFIYSSGRLTLVFKGSSHGTVNRRSTRKLWLGPFYPRDKFADSLQFMFLLRIE